MYAFVPGEAAAVDLPICDDSVTVVNSADDKNDDDDASLGPNPAGNDGDNSYEDDCNNGGNNAYDNDAGND